MKMLIKNANIITPFEIKRNSSLVVENGKISAVFSGDTIDETGFAEVVDAAGKYLAPGFIDIHNHGNFGHDTMEGTDEAVRSMADQHLQHGVTSFLLTTMTSAMGDIKKALRKAAEYTKAEVDAERPVAQVLGVYLEGPYFSEEKKGAQPAEHLKEISVSELQGLIEAAQNTIRVASLAPELDGAVEAVRFLKEQGITVAAGHSMATFAQTKAAADAGLTLATHLYNGMRNFSHREPGIIGAVLTDERVYGEIICDGIHVHVGAMDLAVKAKGKDRIVLVTDAMMAAGMPDGVYELGGQTVYVKDGTATLEDGTLAGSTLTMNKAVYNMVNLVNVPLQDAVRMASLNPATAIGVSDRKGSIELGKDADLIIFDDNLDVSWAAVQGKPRRM